MTQSKQQLYVNDIVWKRCLFYATVLFSVACLCLFFMQRQAGFYIADFSQYWLYYVFFLISAIFTDFKGFPHPNFGYVSFDRISQIASILVLGIVPAAIINGFASFIFPLVNKDYLDNDKKAIAVATFHNSGMMIFMILLAGFLYQQLGGQIPLLDIPWEQALWLTILLITMQIINSIMMRFLIKLRQQKLNKYFNWFTTLVEFSSGFAGIFFAIVLNAMSINVIILFILLLFIAIVSLNNFAHLQSNLEKIVLQRTHELHEKTKLLAHQASHDAMTGLVNRAYINKHIKQLLKSKNYDNASIFIAFADIDNFKSINDTYSHDAGDVVLKKISNILQQFCNDSLIIARFGGEEFLLCFSSTNKAKAIAVCEEIRQVVKSLEFAEISPSLKVTLSIGLTNANEKSLHKTLISRADNNLYQAKDLGKDRIIYN